jgi:hypothetical protein
MHTDTEICSGSFQWYCVQDVFVRRRRPFGFSASARPCLIGGVKMPTSRGSRHMFTACFPAAFTASALMTLCWFACLEVRETALQSIRKRRDLSLTFSPGLGAVTDAFTLERALHRSAQTDSEHTKAGCGLDWNCTPLNKAMVDCNRRMHCRH